MNELLKTVWFSSVLLMAAESFEFLVSLRKQCVSWIWSIPFMPSMRLNCIVLVWRKRLAENWNQNKVVCISCAGCTFTPSMTDRVMNCQILVLRERKVSNLSVFAEPEAASALSFFILNHEDSWTWALRWQLRQSCWVSQVQGQRPRHIHRRSSPLPCVDLRMIVRPSAIW